MRRAVSGIVSQIGARASRTITLVTGSTGAEPMAGMIWVSSDASQESLCRLFTQPPLIALWQTRAASANIGTDRIAVAASRSTSSPLAIRVRRSTDLARAFAKLSFAVEPQPRSRRLPSTCVLSTHDRDQIGRAHV